MSDDLLTQVRDAGYTAVGFGVLAFQRAQVVRREVVKDLGRRVGGKAGVAQAVRRVEKAVDPVLDGVEQKLPGQVRMAFHTARVAGRTLGDAVLR